MATDGSLRPGHDALGFDHVDDEAYTALAADLREAVDGEVRFDEYAQVLYATDGSIYQARPAGVVVPETTADVAAAVSVAADHEVPIMPRGAGTSLAGQGIGPGCVVLDCSVELDDVLSVDPEAQVARIQPGVVQDDLDERLEPHGLQFAPDPASSARATVGGGIGNNSTGAHSVRYGITDAYVREVEVVLPDGTRAEFGDVVLDSPEWDDLVSRDDRVAELHRTVRDIVAENEAEIESRYPELKRSVSGYNLNKVVREEDGEQVMNLAKLVVGAEGTLGVVVEAELDLVTRPDERALAVYAYDDLVTALAAVPDALSHEVSAVELVDDQVVAMARESQAYAEYAEPIPEDAAALLMVEFDSELHDDFAAAMADVTTTLQTEGDAFDRIEAYDADAQARLWKLRKAAIPLLMSMEGDPKPYPFIEDASVPPDQLAEYVQEFQAVLEKHGTSAAYFAHAGVGTLHIRPILNLKDGADVETMHAIADDVTDLVLEYHGSFSGEHGDGMARTEFTPKMYGDALWDAFKRVKTAFDPQWLCHPGNVVYRDSPDDHGPATKRGVGADMREHLRYGPAYQTVEPQTALDFDDDGGFAHLVELCNGCGTCRQEGSGTMCPTYRASQEELQTTRGRANMLRAAISGELDEDELYSERFQAEVLDLCVGCKGCASDCPTGVDLAKLKSEVKHQYHEREGATLRERLFRDIDRWAALGSKLAPVSNWAAKLPGSRAVAETVAGIAPERELPSFQRESFTDWFDARGSSVSASGADHRVVLVPDTYTNYTDPAVGKAAVRVLEAAGVHVAVPADLGPSGRPAYSLGFLDHARDRAETFVETVAPRVDDGWQVVFVEPSEAVMVQDEYADLLPASPDRDAVMAATSGLCRFLDEHRLAEAIDFAAPDERLVYHGHCNEKAIGQDHHAVGVLRRAGYRVDPLDSGCCGMAGSFGYETEHYDLSQAIGRILFEQVDDADGTPVAPGASCRTQLGDRPGAERPPHPVEKLAEALPGEE
ncbi:FAD-binding and (Fe-S)-binding domain-containing protein [Haloarchaeobius amylolyticus]|uniref:FAD-binding and (Fe-S)-binding domain-containing protein n=1 Tax=Haloarchaeobius amylolyticus TaxID=1198296 RepID=UPI00226D49D1|nr:FAD-binding and (Fe-S)-binding domain-containing protein [Haloarchaeobius amylolyticus]